MGGVNGRVDYFHELPACCGSGRLRLPRPDEAVFDVRGRFGRDETWYAGFDEWSVHVGVCWNDDDPAVFDAVAQHLGQEDVEFERALAEHGVVFDEEGYAWVGDANLLMARLGHLGVGRRTISSGFDLYDAADEVGGDLERLVGALVVQAEDDEEEMWRAAVLEAWPNAEIETVLLLRSARVTPVMRGHQLGSWALARGIELFDEAATLVAAEAAPIHWADAIRDIEPGQHELNPEQWVLWNAERERLAKHWEDQLGLIPTGDRPGILTWHTMYRNDAYEKLLELWE